MAKSKNTRFFRRVKRNLKNLKKRTIIFAALVQVLLISFLINGITDSKPIKVQDTQQVLITVEKTKNTGVSKGPQWFIVYSDSQKYYFDNFGIFGKYSNSELNEHISVGENLTLTYYEKYHLFANRNWVVEAENETEAFRTLDEYNELNSGTGILAAVIVIFCILEIIYCLFPFLFILYSLKAVAAAAALVLLFFLSFFHLFPADKSVHIVKKEYRKAHNHWQVRKILCCRKYPQHNKHDIVCGVTECIVRTAESRKRCSNIACQYGNGAWHKVGSVKCLKDKIKRNRYRNRRKNKKNDFLFVELAYFNFRTFLVWVTYP